MDRLILHLIENPKDALSIFAMLTVVYLLKAIRDDQEKRLSHFEAVLHEQTKELKEIRIQFIGIQLDGEQINDLKEEVHDLRKRVRHLEGAPLGL